MLVMTAKVDSKKIAIILTAVVALILGVILLLGGKDTQTSAPALSTNEGRVKFLTDFVKKHSFIPFGVYRIILGAALIVWFLVK